ncbi:hypothetical protein ACQEUU_33965 [Nonomuraea sp. CA-218870]|uniref:Uncharacterized protein n=1 Tax=Nonomuraea corallina TaxID=2989783 RepID=A0ABT4SAW4_9ACTN|nr:hypothetical protein [Nonomuraea corallina]MDA0634358.1 hypothetical protein [Nonomuraea corallina]
MTMASRGFVGFVTDHTEKIAYNHFDSGPDGIGLLVLAWLRTAAKTPDLLRERVAALRVVRSDTRPTVEDIERLGEYADDLSSCGVTSWVELLWKTQGGPEAMLRAGVIEDASCYPVESSDCEWGYLVDLDTQVFEVYRGRQAAPHNRGRFATRPHPHDHYPAALVTGWRFDQLPSDEEFLTTL